MWSIKFQLWLCYSTLYYITLTKNGENTVTRYYPKPPYGHDVASKYAETIAASGTVFNFNKRLKQKIMIKSHLYTGANFFIVRMCGYQTSNIKILIGNVGHLSFWYTPNNLRHVRANNSTNHQTSQSREQPGLILETQLAPFSPAARSYQRF